MPENEKPPVIRGDIYCAKNRSVNEFTDLFDKERIWFLSVLVIVFILLILLIFVILLVVVLVVLLIVIVLVVLLIVVLVFVVVHHVFLLNF